MDENYKGDKYDLTVLVVMAGLLIVLVVAMSLAWFIAISEKNGEIEGLRRAIYDKDIAIEKLKP